eukprot:g18502.t1
MLAPATNAAGGGKSDGDKRSEAMTVAPPPAQAARPRALRIDVQLAENHGRRMGRGAAGAVGRIDEKNRSKTNTTKRPSQQSGQPHTTTYNIAESGGGGSDDENKTRKVARLRVDVGLAESNARAEGPTAAVATGGMDRLRDLLENRRRSGVVTRSTGRRTNPSGIVVPKNVVTDGEDKKMMPSDGVPQTHGGDGGSGGGAADNRDKANDATCSRSAGKRVLRDVERYSCPEQQGAAVMAVGGEAAFSTGRVGVPSEFREGQGRPKRLLHGGVTEARREKPRGQNSKSTFREANAAYMELRSLADETDSRCAAAIKTLQAASRAVASPGEELNRSYEAYCHAYRSLQAAERSVRDAEQQEDAAVDELRMAGEVVDAAEGEVSRAAKNLRDFDAGHGNRSNSDNARPQSDTASKLRSDGGGGGGGGSHDGCDGSGRDGAPPPVLPNEVSSLPSKAHKHDKSSSPAREILLLALETASSNADQAAAELYCAQEAALAAMTLVGARTAGGWSLAREACDVAKKRFQRAGLEAIPKIKLFSEEARLFRNLNKLRGDTRQRLSAASQAREEAHVAATEAAAAPVTRRMSAPVAAAVAVKAAAEAAARTATRCGGEGENGPLAAPAPKQEGKDGAEEEEGGREEDGENDREGEDEATRQWSLPAAPMASAAASKKEGWAMKKAEK